MKRLLFLVGDEIVVDLSKLSSDQHGLRVFRVYRIHDNVCYAKDGDFMCNFNLLFLSQNKVAWLYRKREDIRKESIRNLLK